MWPSMTKIVPFLCDGIKERLQSLKSSHELLDHTPIILITASFMLTTVHISLLSNTMLKDLNPKVTFALSPHHVSPKPHQGRSR